MASQVKEVVDTVSKACAYGDFDKLRAFIESDPQLVNKPDEQGYYPLQWAALNNRVSETNFLLSHGASVNLTDGTGQTALHWAAVRGSLPVIEALLRHNADFEARDNRGYTACHVAAQYGQTAVLYHLALKWGVDIDTADHDGRTALHWAAYKGFADTIRLLLVLDARYTLPDKEGCTALHWAAIKGNGEACTVLLQGGSQSVLTMRDITGSTPAQLAIEKGHRFLGLHLAEYKMKGDGGGYWFGKNGKLAWLTSIQLCPVIWILILGLLLLFIHYVIYPVSALSPAVKFWAYSAILMSTIGLFFLFKTTTADPGFIPTGWDTSSKRDESSPSNSLLQRHSNLDSPALWAGNWHQLCVSCRIVRPLRAKHCSVTDRCIEVFDHFCPWVGNAIGKGNRHWFLLFLLFEMYAQIVTAAVGIACIRLNFGLDGWGASRMVWMLVFEIIDVFVGISVAALAIAQASQVGRNVTTNELANWHRYKYLQASDGSFTNPFSHGCYRNCIEAHTPATTPMAPVYLAKEDLAHTHACHGGSCC